jgi:hypothetical protein
MRTCFRKVLPAAIGLAALALVGVSAPAAAQVTTGAIRGRVLSTDGQPVSDAEVVAINLGTGISNRTMSDASGQYRFPALPLGTYNVQTRRIGYTPVQRPSVRLRLGQTFVANFTLAATAVAVEELTVTAELAPLIDMDQTATVDLVSSEDVEAIPVNGRNFADLIALSPMVGVGAGDGTGGNFSLAGGRRGANNIQIDGTGATGTFFGGEARGSDRIPFAYSIEAVREFQIVTDGFDVDYGFFSGGVVNAVTKSGTNEFHGSLFGYLRDDAITRNDFLGRKPEFTSKQVGGTFSGPLVRDKLHFYLAVERQDRNEPVFGLPAPGSTPDIDTRVHPDSVERFLDILSQVYGVEDQAGQFLQTQDEWTIFGRIDWQISNAHRLTLRHNYTDLEQQSDRINPDETFLNGGVFSNTGNSTVATLNSIFSPNVWNEARVQLAFEPRPREANTLLPEAEVFVDSDFDPAVDSDGDGDPTNDRDASVGLECCGDGVLPNNLEETTFEFRNNLNIRAGDHGIKLGVHFNMFDYTNFFLFGQQGAYDFDGLSDFENGIVDDFNRGLPNPGPDGQFFTDDDVIPLAEYKTYELALYAQDTWHVNDRLSLTGGVRADWTFTPEEAPQNPDALADIGLNTAQKAEDANISPRFSFTYDPTGRGESVLRGGVGLFFGRFPSVLYSNALLNTGQNQVFLLCFSDGDIPVIDVFQNHTGLESTPTDCAGFGFPGTPNVNAFAPDFEFPRTWKASLGFEQALTDNLKVGVDFLYSDTKNNFYVEDRNLLGSQFTSAIEGRPVHAPASELDSGDGDPGFGDNTVTTSIADGLLHVSTAEARTYQVSVGLEQRGSTFSWRAGYTYTNTKDHASYSCCISSTAQFETPTAGNPNFLGARGDELVGTWGPADFSRPHTIVLSGMVNLPYDFSVSGIWRTYSGTPWTPVIDGDANADGNTDNDRAFISRNLSFDSPADAADFDRLLNQHECLREQEGNIAKRNSCRNDMYTQLDLRLRKRFRAYRDHSFEVIVDFFNVLNMINSEWSKNIGVSGTADDRALLEIEGFDENTNTYTYSVNPSFAQKLDLTNFRTDQGSVQVGIKYQF